MFRNNNHTKNGFTLIELLFVLVIWSILILLVVPINFSYLEKQQEKYFFETFAFDVLYTQNLSTTTKEYVQINIYKDHYTLKKGYKGEVLLTRSIPDNWSLQPRVLRSISFDDKGRIRTPGNFIIQTKHNQYLVVFPFGKGRYHIVEQ